MATITIPLSEERFLKLQELAKEAKLPQVRLKLA